MSRLALALSAGLALAPLAAAAQGFGCPAGLHQQVHELTRRAAAGEETPEDLGARATELVQACGQERALLGQFVEMFTLAGLALAPPDPGRFRAHLNAFRTANSILKAGAAPFAPLSLVGPDGAPLEWGPLDERNAYWDLMFAMSSDFLVFGAHADLYTPGVTETVGCGLYPAEEAAALAEQAADNADGAELVARVVFLGRACDDAARDVSGYAARYFAAHYRARSADPGYLGLTAGDIRAGLQAYLTRHLDGAAESALFSAAEAAELLGF